MALSVKRDLRLNQTGPEAVIPKFWTKTAMAQQNAPG
jgi:hypothetical protein